MPKLSVIIPVYCVENLIERCARSLFEQSLDDIEYLFIDDCTPDKSIDILKRTLEDYPHRKSQVVIHRMDHNSGQAVVRKWGIQHSCGDFIVHCDSDDCVCADAYKTCYDAAISGKYDIVFFDFDRSDGIHHNYINRNIPLEKDLLLGGLISGNIMGALWGMVVHRSIYSSISVWPKGNMNEDLVLSVQLINSANRFFYIPQIYYMYYYNKNSITAINDKRKTLTNFESACVNVNLLIDYLNNNKLSLKFQNEIVALKCAKLNLLAHCLLDSEIRKIWKRTYPEIGFRILFNPSVRRTDKIVYFLSQIMVYPILYKLRHER